ncbi:hypothetical protein [Actinokineospora bangkokensis]|uniref:Uncharacterized protein n=1 Tax=Actinokineospora bangkokensis TaxID=1193682 RepID=A0A1Q9LLX2_9PSEU|nr:hypothetical protein [Actinokineospora bangkokensis]OLR92993.1 hypothetical protein BJP25_18695 [Actinokineospora bangkokensis]
MPTVVPDPSDGDGLRLMPALGAKEHLAEMGNAEDETHALQAVKAFEAAYGATYPKAARFERGHLVERGIEREQGATA